MILCIQGWMLWHCTASCCLFYTRKPREKELSWFLVRVWVMRNLSLGKVDLEMLTIHDGDTRVRPIQTFNCYCIVCELREIRWLQVAHRTSSAIIYRSTIRGYEFVWRRNVTSVWLGDWSRITKGWQRITWIRIIWLVLYSNPVFSLVPLRKPSLCLYSSNRSIYCDTSCGVHSVHPQWLLLAL